jgi:hypothetical protein
MTAYAVRESLLELVVVVDAAAAAQLALLSLCRPFVPISIK